MNIFFLFCACSGFRVQGLGFRVLVLGFRVWIKVSFM